MFWIFSTAAHLPFVTPVTAVAGVAIKHCRHLMEVPP
jgi:hypothetical protein